MREKKTDGTREPNYELEAHETNVQDNAVYTEKFALISTRYSPHSHEGSVRAACRAPVLPY